MFGSHSGPGRRGGAPNLPEPIRAGILAMVKAASGPGGGR